MKNGGIIQPKVYVLIDVSNIRSCCLRTCDFRISFTKLIKYLKQKYLNLQDVRYYEGIASGDLKKMNEFEKLKRAGYTIKTLTRKSYTNPAVYANYKCKKCHYQNKVKILSKSVKLKSNVDVFLATELLEIAFSAKTPTHVLLFTCDGDYAEAIKAAARNSNITISVVATPPTKDYERNTLSMRLKTLRKELPDQYELDNIVTIKDFIS